MLLCKAIRESVKDIMGVKLPPLHPSTWAKDVIAGHMISADAANAIVCGVWLLWTGRDARVHGSSRSDTGTTDGAFDAIADDGASGVDLRNGRGQAIPAKGRKCKHLADALTAEALAARNGLLLAMAMGCNKVILESDNQLLVNSLKLME